MDLENGEMAPQSPEPLEPEHSPTEPKDSDDEEMDAGMVGLPKTCSGSDETRKIVQRDSDEIM